MKRRGDPEALGDRSDGRWPRRQTLPAPTHAEGVRSGEGSSSC